jgi:NitT/TauT family transport system substrate-binding protein
VYRRSLIAAVAAMSAFVLPAQAETPVVARLGVIPIMGAAPVYVAQRENWFAERGLKLAITTFESGPNMIQALASGTIDIYVAGVAPLAVARARGIDVRVVAATAVGENVFVGGPKLSALFKPGVTSAEAFHAFRQASGKPARLATQPAGSVPNTTLQYWLREVVKADPADYEIVPMGIDATQQAMLAGAMDGASVREPAVTILSDRNPKIRLLALGDDVFPGQPGTVVAVSGAFMTAHPEAVQALVSGLVKAGALLKATPEKAVPAIVDALGKGIVEPDVIRRALASKATVFQIDPRVVFDASRRMQSYQVKLGSLEKDVTFDGLFDYRFYEAALAGK